MCTLICRNTSDAFTIFYYLMIRLIISIFSLTSFTLHGCSDNKKPVELIEFFNKNKIILNAVIDKLEKDKTLNNLFQIKPDSGLPDIESSYPDMYALLKEAGITDASSHKNSFPKQTYWYYLKTNWENEHPIYLFFNACDSSETIKGFYLKDELSNQTWGLGDHYKMFRFIKYKSSKQ